MLKFSDCIIYLQCSIIHPNLFFFSLAKEKFIQKAPGVSIQVQDSFTILI